MAYERWHMTTPAAEALTGTAGLDEAALLAAEEDLVDMLGWRPNPGNYSDAVDAVTGHPADRRVEAFGKAVAWQAAHRAASDANPDDQAVRITQESTAEWGASYAGGRVDDPIVAGRARRLLARSGWLARGSAGVTIP